VAGAACGVKEVGSGLWSDSPPPPARAAWSSERLASQPLKAHSAQPRTRTQFFLNPPKAAQSLPVGMELARAWSAALCFLSPASQCVKNHVDSSWSHHVPVMLHKTG
jgi:hypothetical protein